MWIRKKAYEHLMMVLQEYESERAEFISLFSIPPRDFNGGFVDWVKNFVGLKDQRIKELTKQLLTLVGKMNQRIDDSSVDPNIRKIRVLLPEELTELINSSLAEIGSGRIHSECSKTLLSVFRTFTEKETI